MFKALISIKTRNPIIFGFHPSAQQCSREAAKIMLEAAVKHGAPADCIQWIEEPSMEKTNALMNHPDVALILATGGSGMVRAAYSCGKPTWGRSGQRALLHRKIGGYRPGGHRPHFVQVVR